MTLASARQRRENARHNGQPPPRRNHHPARAFAFRFLQQHIRNNAIAEEDQHHRPHELSEHSRYHLSIPPANRMSV